MSVSSDFAVVCWKWTPAPNYRSTFAPETVNTLQRMVGRHFRRPHRFICVTDDARGLNPSIETLPLWPDFATLPNPNGPKFPSCYRRLRAFAPDIADAFGPRFVSLDLDTVITSDVAPLWDRPEPFVIWGATHVSTPYNGSMFLLSAGARPRVWTEFDPATSPQRSVAAGFHGSDQGWISYCLGPREARWSESDGVYSFRLHVRRRGNLLPPNARVVCFHGQYDPWSPEAKRLEWVKRHYQ